MSPKNNSTAKARSAARLAAVQALYQMELAGTDLNEIVPEFNAFRLQGEISGDDEAEIDAIAGADQTFFAELVKGAVARQRDIDPVVDKQLAQGWRLVRVDSTLRAIFRSAVFELIDRHDVPARVVINEYINIAHAFFDDDNPKVVNGLLDRLARQYRPDEFEGDPPAKKSA